MNIVIAGASGLTGSACLKLLVDEPRITRIVSIGRRPGNLKSERLEEILLTPDGHFPPDRASTLRADAFIGCLGTTIRDAGSKRAFRAVDFDLMLELARLARAAGARTAAVVSALGADAKSLIFYSRVKGETEDALAALGFESLTFLRPSVIDGKRARPRFGEGFALAALRAVGPVLGGPLENFAAVPAERIAAELVSAVICSDPGRRIVASAEIGKDL